VRGTASSISPNSVSKWRRYQPLRRSAQPSFGHALEVRIDQQVHPAAQQLRDRSTGALAIVCAPFEPFGLHGLHHPKRGW
jgi:hypothetical protein